MTPTSYTVPDLLLHRRIEQMLNNLDDYQPLHYPVYIPSRHRADRPVTTKVFDQYGIDYRVVVEPHDYDSYAATYSTDRIVTLPEDNQGIAYVRNYILEHAKSEGYDYFWMFDDDIRSFQIRRDGKQYNTDPRPLLSILEQINDSYTNIGGSCLAHSAFNFSNDDKAPVVYNAQIYCAELITTKTQSRFRKGVADDIDFSLQILTEGWVTLVYKRFGFTSVVSGTAKGGLADTEYKDDGRLAMFQQLQANWPGAFNIGYHKDGRPHIISRGYYSRFTQRPEPKKQ